MKALSTISLMTFPFLLALLAGCKSLSPPPQPAAFAKEQALRAQLQAWEINGILGGRAKNQAFSMRFHFLTCNDNYQADFTGPLGIQLLQIVKENHLILVQQGKKRFTITEKELLNTPLPYFPLPIAEFKNWLKGASPQTQSTLLQTLQEGDWTLEYQDYAVVTTPSAETIRLPRLIAFHHQNENIQGKMIISHWEIEPTVCQTPNPT